MGRILSLPETGAPLLNVPVVVSGRLPDPAAQDEVAVNEPFAEANHFRPGDRFSANLNGRRRELTITGTLLSPEFIYTLPPGGMMPDNKGFGILWMPRARRRRRLRHDRRLQRRRAEAAPRCRPGRGDRRGGPVAGALRRPRRL